MPTVLQALQKLANNGVSSSPAPVCASKLAPFFPSFFQTYSAYSLVEPPKQNLCSAPTVLASQVEEPINPRELQHQVDALLAEKRELKSKCEGQEREIERQKLANDNLLSCIQSKTLEVQAVNSSVKGATFEQRIATLCQDIVKSPLLKGVEFERSKGNFETDGFFWYESGHKRVKLMTTEMKDYKANINQAAGLKKLERDQLFNDCGVTAFIARKVGFSLGDQRPITQITLSDDVLFLPFFEENLEESVDCLKMILIHRKMLIDDEIPQEEANVLKHDVANILKVMRFCHSNNRQAIKLLVENEDVYVQQLVEAHNRVKEIFDLRTSKFDKNASKHGKERSQHHCLTKAREISGFPVLKKPKF